MIDFILIIAVSLEECVDVVCGAGAAQEICAKAIFKVKKAQSPESVREAAIDKNDC
jgi:hypothetical protein